MMQDKTENRAVAEPGNNPENNENFEAKSNQPPDIQPTHDSTETDDIGCHRSPNEKILWTTFYVILFLAFAIGLIWFARRMYPTTIKETILLLDKKIRAGGNDQQIMQWKAMPRLQKETAAREVLKETKAGLFRVGIGSVLCLAATSYLIYRYCQLSSTYGDIEHGYVPIFYCFVIGGVIPSVICLGVATLWNYIFTPRSTGEPMWQEILNSTITGGALPEECLKFVIYFVGFLFFAQEPTDDMMIRFMVLQATATGMGFGIQEAFLYVAGTNGDWEQIFVRMIALVPMHSMWAYISGCWYVTKVLEASTSRIVLEGWNYFFAFASSIWCSILLHAVYNTAVTLTGAITGVDPRRLAEYCIMVAVLSLSWYICRVRFHILKQTLADFEELFEAQDPEKGLRLKVIPECVDGVPDWGVTKPAL